MFESNQFLQLLAVKMRNIFRRVFLVLMVSGKVTVLLFIIILGAVRAGGASGTDMHLFEFTSEFYMPMGNGRIDGLMASDVSRQRIAIYWIEPAVYHDSSYFLCYSDFIFENDIVHYCIHGMSQPKTFDSSNRDNVPLLPRDISPESVARSALAIVNRIRSESEQTDIPLEVGKFFRESRDQNNFSYEVPSEQVISDESSINSISDEQILNALPYGRKYSKETQSNGAIVWQAERVLDGPHVARVTIKPVPFTRHNYDVSIFNPNTLGWWTFVPEAYRAYWSFDRAYSESKDATDGISSRELYDKIEFYIDRNKIPKLVDLAFNQLLFKTAMLTGDKKCVCRSAHSVLTAFCRESTVSGYQGLLELARIDDQIREKYPEQADDLVCPLIGLMIKHIGQDTLSSIERFMPAIESNKWFQYGKLLIDEARVQGLVEKNVADTFTARLEASRLVSTRAPVDPCEVCSSVKLYLAQIDDDPPEGNLTINDVREILEKVLEKSFADANMELKHELIENVIQSIRLIVGEGPFRGDKGKLIESVERFSGLYLVVFRYKEPIDTVLATFLALSFCDISTPDDHDVLFSQIQKICAEFQTQTNKMLAERGLSELVEPNDVERLFRMYERKFRNYIDDPLWPAFKFPLTANEQARLRNKIKLRFGQLEPLFEEMALKVKYGGSSPELKDKTIFNISLAAQQLLPQSAFLRKPSYPGVFCRYRGAGHGFTAVIKGPLYIEGERPKEKFKTMKYFHLGHRLEEIVKRERELATSR